MRELVLKVEGMSCGHCVKAVEEALQAVAGVVEASVSLADSRAGVKTTDSLGLACVQAIEEEGYRAEVMKESTIPL
ncbi:MAG: heavy-metal-associated domain-containing protein [Pirellulaceae bacterium]